MNLDDLNEHWTDHFTEEELERMEESEDEWEAVRIMHE